MVNDPVCGMALDETKLTNQASYNGLTYIGKSEYRGQSYYFCSANCKRHFDHSPEYYLERQARSTGATDDPKG